MTPSSVTTENYLLSGDNDGGDGFDLLPLVKERQSVVLLQLLVNGLQEGQPVVVVGRDLKHVIIHNYIIILNIIY